MPEEPEIAQGQAAELSVAPTLPSAQPAGRLGRGEAVGRYLILDRIGEGGMGTVYSAYDPELDRKVAIKLLKVSGDSPEAARARLLKEAQAMARLSHANVLSVFDAGAHGEGLFMAMELVEGVTLGDWLRGGGRSRREILEAFLQAGEGLAAAHRAGLVHRDFKPENVLVGRDGRMRVTDFGLAHLEDRPAPLPGGRSAAGAGTVAGVIAGTPGYMAPEQLAAEPTDARTDQFSFCVALWEALLGKRPFAGEDLDSARRAVLSGPAPVAPAGLPLYLRGPLLRGLSQRPEGRYARMEDLLAALRRDPVGRALRAGPFALAAVAVLALSGLLLGRAHQERVRCARAGAEAVAAHWGPQRKASLQASLAGGALGPEPAAAALEDLERRFQGLGEARREAFEAGRAAGEPPDPAVVGCLERWGLRSGAAVALLADPELDARRRIWALLDALGEPKACLRRSRPQPARRGGDASGLQADIERLVLLSRIGRAAQIVAVAPAIVAQAREAGALAEAAQAGLVLGAALLRTRGAGEEAAAVLQQALLDADAGQNDEVSLRARVVLARMHAVDLGDAGAAEPHARAAEAWLERLGRPPLLEIEVLSVRASIAGVLERREEAIGLRRRAKDLALEALGPQAVLTVWQINDLATELAAVGRQADSLSEFLLAAKLADRGPIESPHFRALAWGNAATMRLNLGRIPEAAEAVAQALSRLEPVREDEPAFQVWLESVRGQILFAQGRAAEAEEVLAAVLSRRDLLDIAGLADARAWRARALAALGRPKEAAPLALEAVALAEQAGERLSRGVARLALAEALRAQGSAQDRLLEAVRGALADFQGAEDGYYRGQAEKLLREVAGGPASRVSR